MVRTACRAALASVLTCLALTAAAAEPIRLRFDPMTILHTVALRMNVTLRPDVPLPTILLQSTTPLARFQQAMALQWRFRPPRYANAYVVASNEIYLMDDASYYRRLGRTLDESLAHEFAHYLQVHYFNADLSDPGCETDAVAMQALFAADRVADAASPPRS
jgi:hypothetical protein